MEQIADRPVLVWGLLEDLERWRQSVGNTMIIRDESDADELARKSDHIGLVHAPTVQAIKHRFPHLDLSLFHLMAAAQKLN